MPETNDDTHQCPLCDGNGNVSTGKTQRDRLIVGMSAQPLFLQHGFKETTLETPLVELALVDVATARDAGVNGMDGKIDNSTAEAVRLKSQSHQLTITALIALKTLIRQVEKFINLDSAHETVMRLDNEQHPNG